MSDLEHTIFQLRNAMKNAEPGPYDLYTSNSFRRVMAFNAVPALLEEIERLREELRAARLEIVDTAREGLRLAAAMREGSTVRVPGVGEL